jgi:hypothetical protein
MHVALSGFGVRPSKQASILERANTHQLIILENPPPLGSEADAGSKTGKADRKTSDETGFGDT